MIRISVIVGNPKPRSRTLRVAETVAGRIAEETGGRVVQVVDLCDYAGDLFKWPDERLAAVSDSLAGCDLLVVASPTYKAAYTGLLKAFLDRYPAMGLSGVTAVPVMTGGCERHAMVVDTTLRPLLVELGASVPTRALFFLMSRMGEMQAVVDQWAVENVATLPTRELQPPSPVTTLTQRYDQQPDHPQRPSAQAQRPERAVVAA
jgi:FMN reductase